jgi:hypothetical protein
MESRACPFCLSMSSVAVGARGDVWNKCPNCHSVFREITHARFDKIHAEAWAGTNSLHAAPGATLTREDVPTDTLDAYARRSAVDRFALVEGGVMAGGR